jgi:dsDNA-binding SOS-regulon protein
MDVYEIYDIMLDVARKLLHYLDALSLCNASHKTTSQISPDALFKRKSKNFFSHILRLREGRISGHRREKGRP